MKTTTQVAEEFYLRTWEKADYLAFEFIVNGKTLPLRELSNCVDKPFFLRAVNWSRTEVRDWPYFWRKRVEYEVCYQFVPANEKYSPLIDPLKSGDSAFVVGEDSGNYPKQKTVLKQVFEECKENENQDGETSETVGERPSGDSLEGDSSSEQLLRFPEQKNNDL